MIRENKFDGQGFTPGMSEWGGGGSPEWVGSRGSSPRIIKCYYNVIA